MKLTFPSLITSTSLLYESKWFYDPNIPHHLQNARITEFAVRLKDICHLCTWPLKGSSWKCSHKLTGLENLMHNFSVEALCRQKKVTVFSGVQCIIIAPIFRFPQCVSLLSLCTYSCLTSHTILFAFYSHNAIQFVALHAALWCVDLCASEWHVISVYNGGKHYHYYSFITNHP